MNLWQHRMNLRYLYEKEPIMRRFLLMAVLGVWLLWACSPPPAQPAIEATAGDTDNTVVVYKSPT